MVRGGHGPSPGIGRYRAALREIKRTIKPILGSRTHLNALLWAAGHPRDPPDEPPLHPVLMILCSAIPVRMRVPSEFLLCAPAHRRQPRAGVVSPKTGILLRLDKRDRGEAMGRRSERGGATA